MWTPTNIDYYIHVRKVFEKDVNKMKNKGIKIPNKLVKKVCIKIFRKIMHDPLLTCKEDAEMYIPRLTVDQ